MNNIFKTIWNKSTQSWVAVSELARGYVKSSSAQKVSLEKNGLSKFSLSTIVLILGLGGSGDIFANYTAHNGVTNGGGQNIAIGRYAQTGDSGKPTNQSIAIGSANRANEGAWAKGDQSIAIGGNTIAEGHSSIVIGGDDVNKAIDQLINYIDNDGVNKNGKLGDAYTSLTGGNLLAPTRYAPTKSGHLGVAVGVKAVASNLSLALGTNAQAKETNTLAIGTGAIASISNSVAIGGGATTEGSEGTKQQGVTLGKTSFSWAGGERVLPGDIVSFGGKGFERQLKNIAPGEVSENSTDAINGSQLNSIAKKLTERSERQVYVHVNTGNAQQGSGDSTTNSGQVDEKGGATGTAAATLGLNAKAAGNNSIALGSNSSASQENSVAIGQGSTTSAVSTDSSNLMITFKNENYTNKTVNLTNGLAKTENGAISFGSVGKERQLHNVAAGRITATSTDVINGSQLYHVAKNLGFNVYQGDSSKARINNDGVVKFVDGAYTTAAVAPENGNAKVTFNVKTSTIDASTMSVTGNDTGGLAKSSDVVAAIKASGFTLNTDGANSGDNKVKHGSTLSINQGDGIAINRNTTTFTVGLNPETKTKIDNIGTGNVAVGDNKTVTGGAVHTAIKNAVDAVHLTFEGDNSAKGNVVLKDGSLKIKGENGSPIETTSSAGTDTLILKIKDASIETKYLKDAAVTTEKIADGNVTFEKLDQAAKNKISEKEESVSSTEAAKALGLIVSETDRKNENKGKLFNIDLNSSTLINKLSENANISSPTTTSPKLVTDVQVKDYISNTPIKLTADNPANPDTNNKVGLGETLSIKGAVGGVITTSVNGSDFTLDLTQDTKNKINLIGTGNIAAGQEGTVTGEKVYQAIDALKLNIAGDSKQGDMKLTSTLNIKGAINGPISTEFNDADDTLSIKIKDSSIQEQHLAPNAVTTNKIADGAITSAKLGDDVSATINAKEESVNATTEANNLGLTVQENPVTGKGKLFTIDLKSETLISKLSENAQIGATAANKLVTDTQLNTYLDSNPLKFQGNLGAPVSRKLGETLSIIGKDGVNDLTSYTDENIATDTSSSKVIIKFKDTPEFKGIKFKNDNNEITVTPTNDGLTFAKNGPNTTVKLGNLADATIDANSKEAVTGSQLHATNERITSLESGWQIAGNDLQKVQDIKKGTNKVNFVNSKNIEATVALRDDGANVSFIAKTESISVDHKTGAITIPNDENNLITAKAVAEALSKTGWLATVDKVDTGEVEGTSLEKISSGDKITFKAGKNLKVTQNGKNFIYSTLDNVNFNKVIATESLGIENGPKLSRTGLDMTDKKVTNLADGEITDTSKDAITGKQLKDLADKLGITPNNTSFTIPNFSAIKGKDSNNGATPTSFKDALDKVIEGLNRGVTFGGDQGNSTTQYLGSTYNVKAAANNISANGKVFVGKNLQTEYTNQGGDGLLSIGLSETPDFKSVTLSDGGSPYLTLGKNANENGGQITGLTNRNATNNADYGTNGNEGRAATEGAVKELSDRVKQADDKSPFVYSDDKGNVLTKANDGKFYPVSSVNPDGTVKQGEDSKKIEPENVVVKVKDANPMPITNVRSGLGLDGKAENGATEGTPESPKAISVEKAKNVIAGNDGQSGLLSKEGAELNKVATVGDLQALAQAGLDFSGNKGDVIHRPLGTKLAILGKDNVNDLAGYSSENIATETTDDNKLYIRFKDKPEFKGITVKDGDDKHQIELTPENGLVVKANKDDATPVKISSSGIDAGESKVTNLVDGNIADNSKDAVTGKQLKNLADKLGVEVDTANNSFATPTFKEKIKNADGTDANEASPTTFKGAIDNVISALNRGIGFIGDIGDGTQYLGSTFAVKAAETTIGNNFVGKNLKTSYTKGNDGNGVLSIGLSETPDFKKITLTDGENNPQPYLSLEKDGDKNTGKITGLTHRNPTNNADNYGKNGNEGRAATEGAVKELSDRVNQGDKNSPFIYEKADGTKIKKAADGKFYPESLVNADGTTKDGASAQEVKPEDVVVKINDNTPMPITNVKSGLGLDGKSSPTGAGTPSLPEAIGKDAAQKAIAGDNKDGKGGLLVKQGVELNKVSTVGDLQALAQAGIDFAGNKGTTVHRPLGTKLDILGNENVSDTDLAKFSTDNIVTETKEDKLYIKFKDIPKLKGLELNSGKTDAKTITISPDDTGSKLTLAGEDTNGVTLDGLKNGEISENSKNAVTGNQLKDLADKLGVEVSDDKSGFKTPEFNAIKGKDGKDAAETDKPKNLKDAINKTIEAVNRGLTFVGDEGNGNQNLGSTFNVKSTNTVITKDNKTFVGKNITTKYEKDADGNGTLSIGISERPDFKEITLTKEGEDKPFLTIGEDTENTDKPTTGKITGLTARDLGSNGYGVGDNVGRAATEGAVKDLYDKVKSNESSSPFEYKDADNNKLVKVGDKYYSEGDLKGKHITDGKVFDKPVVKDGDKYYLAGPDGKKTTNEANPITVAEKTPATASNKQLTDISNVRSGLGLDGKSATNPAEGSAADPKAISAEKAKEVIAGKDGKSGLLTTEGAPLNKVATIGDLQAVAKAGLTFKGNNTDAEVHRPLGTELNITGDADGQDTSAKNVYVRANKDSSTLKIEIKEKPEFKGLELKDSNTNAIKFTPSETTNNTDPTQKDSVLTLSSGVSADGKPGTVKLTGISDGDISPNSKDAVNGSQVFALTAGKPAPKVQDKYITIVNPDGTTTNIDAKNVIVDENGNPLLKTYNVQGQGEHIQNSVITAINNMNNEGIKFFHTNDGRDASKRPQTQSLNQEDSSAGGSYATAVGYRANAAGTNGIAFGSDAVAGKITGEKEATITEVVNGKATTVTRKVRIVEGVNNAIAIGAGALASNDHAVAMGANNQVYSKNSTAIGSDNKIGEASEKTFVLGNNVTETIARSVFLGDTVGYVAADNKAGTTKGNAEYSEQKIGETTYKYAGGKANEVVGVVSVGNVKQDGAMETRRIQNVAPGLISDKSTDAINGSQLYAVMDSGWNLKAEEVDGTSGKVTKGKADTTKVSIGKTVKVRAGNNVEIAHNKDESIDISTSMAPTFNSLNVNPGGTVNMGGNRVQNVGNAVEAGDAVNYGQFKAEVGKLDSRLQAGIAGAVASGTLVQAFNPNESLVAVGAGTYRGKSAVALGYSRVSDNGKIIIKVTGSTNTYGDVTGGASVGYKF